MFQLTAPLEPSFLPIVFAQGLVATLFFGWLPLYLPELFPVEVRATGAGTVDEHRPLRHRRRRPGAGSLFVYFDGQLPAIGAACAFIYALGMLVVFWAPNTAGKATMNHHSTSTRSPTLPAWHRRGSSARACSPNAAPSLRRRSIAASERYKIGVCDWMILKRQKLGAFKWTKDIGADGVEVDMGSLGKRDTFDNQLADPEIRQQFLDTARDTGLEICSLAMSGFYAQSFAERPTVPRMVQDCIDTMVAMNVKVAFLPLGVLGDLRAAPRTAARRSSSDSKHSAPRPKRPA